MAHVKLRRIGRPCGRVEILRDHEQPIAGREFVLAVLPGKELGGLAAARHHQGRFAELRTAPRAGPAIDGMGRALEGLGGIAAGQTGRAALAEPGVTGDHVTVTAGNLPRPMVMSGRPGRAGGTQGARTVARPRSHRSGQAAGSRQID